MSRKSYPNVNAANQYARDVVRGKIVACQFVIQACQRHLDDLMAEKSKSFRYRFDKDLAERAAKFIQLLPHTKGEWAFKRMPITLEPWQLFVICCAFGWVNKGSRLRRFREVYTEIPRKNGKSAISAGVALYCFACDNEFGAEVYSGATTEKQAWEVFRPARLMCKRTPMLTEAFGIEVNASNMNRPEDGARFEPLIGNPGDGSSPHCAVVDEYHEHATDALYTTMLTGMGARRQPLMWAITTAGYNIEGPCYDKRREAAIESGRFHHDGNPIMTWCIGNVVGKTIPGNDDVVKPVKEQAENKIDGAVALIMAVGRAMLYEKEDTLSDHIESYGIRSL